MMRGADTSDFEVSFALFQSHNQKLVNITDHTPTREPVFEQAEMTPAAEEPMFEAPMTGWQDPADEFSDEDFKFQVSGNKQDQMFEANFIIAFAFVIGVGYGTCLLLIFQGSLICAVTKV